MRLRLVLFLTALMSALACTPGVGAAESYAAGAMRPAVPLYKAIGAVDFPVATKSRNAQDYFNQGLAFAYGFNHDEAELSFRRAAQIDPKLAMAYWGIALVLGPNYNLPGDQDRGIRAYKAMERARALGGGTARERDLIEALAHRYGDDGKETPARDQAYADAMRAVAHRYPGDADVQALFAESLMDLHPWQLWSDDGKPNVDTIEIVSTLEAVLKTHPEHLGANHYYIHAVEASPHPERALPSAGRLASLAPALGHLVHMPAHIYIRTGRYHAAALANEDAIRADEAFFAASNEGGVYPLMYYTHNLQFLCYVLMMEGRSREALASARKLNQRVTAAAVREMPMAEFLLPMPLFVEDRFGQWDAVMQEPEPPADLAYASAIWHYSRGLALAARGHLDRARAERDRLHKIVVSIDPSRILGTSNNERKVCELAEAILEGEIAAAGGDRAPAIARLTAAVAVQDTLIYDEPPIWYFPVREALGAELIAAGKPAPAEAVYRKDLKLNPENPRSLDGLAQALRAQGRSDEARQYERRFKSAWRYADAPPAPAHGDSGAISSGKPAID